MSVSKKKENVETDDDALFDMLRNGLAGGGETGGTGTGGTGTGGNGSGGMTGDNGGQTKFTHVEFGKTGNETHTVDPDQKGGGRTGGARTAPAFRFEPGKGFGICLILILIFCIAFLTPDSFSGAFGSIAQSLEVLVGPVLQVMENTAVMVVGWLSRRDLIWNLVAILAAALVCRELLSSHRLSRLLLVYAAYLGGAVLIIYAMIPAAKEVASNQDGQQALLLLLFLVFLVMVGVLLYRAIHRYLGTTGKTSSFETLFSKRGAPVRDPAEEARLKAERRERRHMTLINSLIFFAACAVVTLLQLLDLKQLGLNPDGLSLPMYLLEHTEKSAVLLLPFLLAALIMTLIQWRKSGGRCTFLTFMVFVELLAVESSMVGKHNMFIHTPYPVLDIVVVLLAYSGVLAAIYAVVHALLNMLVEGEFPDLFGGWSNVPKEDAEHSFGARIRLTLRSAIEAVGRVIVHVVRALWVLCFVGDLIESKEGLNGAHDFGYVSGVDPVPAPGPAPAPDPEPAPAPDPEPVPGPDPEPEPDDDIDFTSAEQETTPPVDGISMEKLNERIQKMWRNDK